MTDWQKVNGSQEIKPEEFDTTISQAVVYQRKNITGESGQWQYDERELSHEEYFVIKSQIQQKLIEQNKADIDYILAMTNIEEG